MKKWVVTRIVDPVRAEINRGVTPLVLARSVALGAVCGVFPIVGITTAVAWLCVALFAAAGIETSTVLVTVVNLVLTPVDIALVPFFISVGAWLIPSAEVSISAFLDALSVSILGALYDFQFVVLRAVLAWILLAPVTYLVLVFALHPVLRRVIRHRVKAEV